jgi:serine/threonine protein phosphatase PrpC
VLDAFVEDGFEYLVEELPTGQSLWDGWDDPGATAEQRFAWLKQIAGMLYHLNQSNALLEALRPDIIVLTPQGQPRLTDLSDLLPLPLPPNPPVRATYYSAPELVLASEQADGRAGIYSFGAMLYALHLGRELTELDFELQGVPKAFLQRFPDAHPLFGRLVSKTFCRDVNGRYPTEDAARKDASGFAELIDTLETCRQTLDRVRLEIASWTTTGMVRSGNEDAFALFHASVAHENQLEETALVLLADGMGGYEAGEVAAALTIQALRNNLLKQKPMAAFAGDAVVAAGHEEQTKFPRPELDVDTCKALLAAALEDANRQVHAAAHADQGRQDMGCTAEAVYVDGRHVVVGHVGDSRTYHLHEGRLLQLTQDQTWVQRMVELGALTPQEAETHPRRSELQQAIGGRPNVEPALYDSPLKPGDWVVICSDGLSNHTPAEDLKELLQSAPSAEWAARRLINHVNLAGATDNATVVVIRAT